jgi:hypothetical protein
VFSDAVEKTGISVDRVKAPALWLSGLLRASLTAFAPVLTAPVFPENGPFQSRPIPQTVTRDANASGLAR